MKTRFFRHTLLVALVALFASCSTTKYVPEGSYLLNRVKVKTDTKQADVSPSRLKGYVRQQENSRWFSVLKLPLATYSLSGRDTARWINRTLRSLGEPPVIFDSLQAELTCRSLEQQLQNEGYLNARVDYSSKTKGKKTNLTFLLHPGDLWFLRNVRYNIADEGIETFLSGDEPNRLLREGMKFDVSKLDAERKRITSLLTDHGYFRFHKEFITYQADTASGSRLIDLTLLLAPYRRTDNEPSSPHRQYVIRNISYGSGDPKDSRIHLRPKVLRESTFLEPHQLYSSTALQNTYNRFGRMQAVKYTNINLQEVPDSSMLDCSILLQTNKPSTISFQPEGTNTAGDLGAAASLTYQNRNLFRGSEVLSIELRGAFEAIKGLEGYSNQDFVEYSAETRLAFPRVVAPFVGSRLRRNPGTTSELSLLYDMQNRPEFHRRVLSAAWRYRWATQNQRHNYQFDLFDLNYVFMPWISTTFRQEYLESSNTRNAILRYNYEDLFITKIGFGYSFNNGATALKTNVETSGNLLAAISGLTGSAKDEQGQYRLFNIAFAQYAKADIDLTHSLNVDRNNHIVLHLGLGVAVPYGNSSMLPFEKRYFSGGANSVRGWSVRALGPGKYKERDGRINFINQTGDMKLDMNVEYRTSLFWKLAGAIFVDAGNIWTLKNYEQQPGGQFRFDTFASQLAVGYGLGMRLNFDYFILRLDLGMKAINPAYEEEDDRHYPILNPHFKRDYAFHFAVGLPF